MYLIGYNFFLLLYRLGVRLAAFWNPKARQWINGRKQIFDTIAGALHEKKQPVIWMHCASLGEFEQGRPVLEELRKCYPGARIVLTFFSPSGFQSRPGLADFVFFLPFDSRKNADRFLDLVQPTLVLWVKYDYWYYYLSRVKQRNIPLLLVSGMFHRNQWVFKWYGGFQRASLHCFTHLFVQTSECKRLLGKLGFIDNVTTAGDTRFDRVLQIAEQFKPVPGLSAFCRDYPVLVAGSTWKEDDEALSHYASVHADMRFIIAPHEIDEARLMDIETLFKRSARYSKLETATNPHGYSYISPAVEAFTATGPRVLIIDNIGMLSRLYKYATIAYVGGGFRESGVHNVLEAAVYGKPVVFGPEYELYVEASDLIDAGGAFSVESAIELEKLLDNLLLNRQLYGDSSQASERFVQARKGATRKIVQYIQENRLLTNL